MMNSMNPDDYTIIDDAIIIHSNVDYPIDFDAINIKFSKLIFANYHKDSFYFHLEKINNFEKVEFTPKYIIQISLFNHPVIFSNNLTQQNQSTQPIQLTHISFGRDFNQQFVPTNNLKFIVFGSNFNQPIIFPNDSQLTHLFFGTWFNQPIILPDNLTHLNFEYLSNFNRPIILPQSLTHLSLGLNLRFIELSNIKYLSIGSNNEYIMNNLPNTLEELILKPAFRLPLNDLPNSIKIIELPMYYDKPLYNIPLNLKIIRVYSKYKFINNLPNSISINILNNDLPYVMM